MSIFNSFISEKPKSKVLAAGQHIVEVLSMVFTNSFTNYDGSEKAGQVWSKFMDQIMVQFGNGDGSIIYRVNGEGFMHTEDIDPVEFEKLGLVDVQGFACKPLKNGLFERIHSEENSEACSNILNKFMDACGVEYGTSLEDFFAHVIANDVKVGIKVAETEWGGKTRYEVYAVFKAVAIEAEAEDVLGG